MHLFPFFLFSIFTMVYPDNTATLFNFNAWVVQDDVVMGGRSSGHLEITEAGHARFYGKVSLENNGGFSSILHTLETPYPANRRTAFSLRLKGDGHSYSFRVKSAAGDGFYHEAEFATTGDWETIVIPFDSMKAVHHGEPVDVPNYAGQTVRKMQLLIGNGKAQRFEVLVDLIEGV